MREGGQRTGSVARATSLLVLASLLLHSGCAGLFRSYDFAPSGLTRAEESFRLRLVRGAADTLLLNDVLRGETAPGDELLRDLYGGVAAYYAGRYPDAGALLDRAALLAQERATKSISRSALSLISNDRVLPYEPPRTERLLIHYYAALAFLQQRDRTGALVEARRLSALLEAYEHEVAADEAALHGALRVFAGAVFQSGGERNDAAVAFRQTGGFAGIDTVLRMPPRDSADVLVFLEQGFVAHRVEEGLSVLLLPDEVYALREGSADDRFGIASLISARVIEGAGERDFAGSRHRQRTTWIGAPLRPVVTRPHRDRCDAAPSITERLGTREDSTPAAPPRPGVKTVTTTTRTTTVTKTDSTGAVTTVTTREECRDDDDEPYLLRVAWPAYRWTSRPPASAALVGAGGDTLAPLRFADLSSAVIQDYRRELPLVVARTIARGAAKAALTRAAERSAEKKNEALGDIVGVLGNIGNVLLERADTRCWHLLPGAIGVARLRLPAGEHALRVQLGGRELDLGTIRVAGRETRVLAARVW